MDVTAALYSQGTLLLAESAGPDGKATKLLLAARNHTLPPPSVNLNALSNSPWLREVVSDLEQHIPGAGWCPVCALGVVCLLWVLYQLFCVFLWGLAGRLVYRARGQRLASGCKGKSQLRAAENLPWHVQSLDCPHISTLPSCTSTLTLLTCPWEDIKAAAVPFHPNFSLACDHAFPTPTHSLCLVPASLFPYTHTHSRSCPHRRDHSHWLPAPGLPAGLRGAPGWQLGSHAG